MTPRFIAKPPLSVDRRSLLNHVRQTFKRLWFIAWQIVVPFKSGPEEIEPFPTPTAEPAEEQLKQSQWIFDQAEKRRVHLEQKAQSTFGLMIFLVPLLASLFVFLSSRVATSGAMSRTLVIGFMLVPALFLLLGFISALRAISVKDGQALFLGSVIEEDGQFRKYSKAFHAQGLLYCAAMNEAMNDHLAQFVKGAHLLTAAAVIVLVILALPASLVLLNSPSSPSQTKIVGPVDVSSAELRAVCADVTSLKQDIQTLSNRQAPAEQFKEFESKLATLEMKMTQLQKTTPRDTGKTSANPQ
jgi:hypothetical protein